MLEMLQAVEAIADKSGDERRLRRALEGIVFCLGGLGDLAGAIRTVERAAAIGDSRLVYQASQAYYGVGNYRRAVDAARAEVDVLAGRHLYARAWGLLLSVRARAWLILSLAELGEFAEARRVVDEALELADHTMNRTDLLFACMTAGRMHQLKGDLPQAIASLERALPLCETGGDCFIYRSRAASWLGLSYALAGRTDEGLALLREALAADESLGFVYSKSFSLVSLGAGHLLAGSVKDAELCAAQALQTARDHGHRGWEAWALRLRGEIGRQLGETDAAAASFHDAIALATELGMRPLLAHCHRGLAGVASSSRARALHLRTANTLYRGMDMRLWLETSRPRRAASTTGRRITRA
jgi:tetratricopeptide (TPR) repeat protein